MAVNGLDNLCLPSPVHPALWGFVGYLRLHSQYSWRVTYGARTDSEQQALFDQGRDADGNVVDPSAVVTDARPGQSAHNNGTAIDLAPVVDSAVQSAAYDEKAALVQSWNALVPGGWQLTTDIVLPSTGRLDRAHVQLSDWVKLGTSWRTLGAALAAGAALLLVVHLAA